MKKLFSIFAVVICTLLITSCMPADTSLKLDQAIEQNFKDVDLTKVESNLEFVKEIDGVTISYATSNENVISSTGEVNQQEEDISVTLRVIYKYGSYSKVKMYDVNVLGKHTLTIATLKKGLESKEVSVTGIVAKIINGTEKNVPVGFYLVDGTDAIYVYASILETMPEVGDQVVVNGQYLTYISENDKPSADFVGYVGSKQITLNNVEVLSKGNKVNYNFATKSSIAELSKIAVSENITSNLYYVRAKVRKAQGNGFVNYYFDDLNGLNSYYAYTTANGKDLGWLEQYDGTIRNCLIAVANAKISASGSFWRIIPIEIGEELEVTDEEYINYALDCAVAQFQEVYQSSCEFNLKAVDESLNATITYMTVSNGCQVSKNENGYTVKLEFVEPCTMSIDVTITYNNKSITRTVTFECKEEIPVVELSTIENARGLSKGDSVNIEGIIAGFLYLKGSTKPAGFELVDKTSSIAVFVNTAVDTKTDITKLSVGEYVIVSGNYDLYQPRDTYEHTGSIRLNNAEVIYHDYKQHDLYEGVIETIDFSSLVNNPSNNNITNKAYYSTFYIEKTTGSYSNYYIHDLTDPTKSMIVYSQNSSSKGPGEYSWLEPFVGKCVKGLITLRIGAPSSGKFVWKSGILSIVGVVDTPVNVTKYFIEGEIKDLFAKEYANGATITYAEANGVIVSFSSSSNQIVFNKEGGMHTITVNEPVLTEKATITVNLNIGDYEYQFTFDVQLTKPELISLAEFREIAKKSGDNVLVEGIVSCLVKSANESTWTFFITDETGTIFCKTKAAVKVGDKVRIQGNTDLYYGLPQVSSNAIVTVISSNNEIPTNSFTKDANITDLVKNNNDGEAAKVGATVYTNVKAILHVSTSRVYISVDNMEIELYNYTNAKYYEEVYKPLEQLDGKEVTLNLVAYNWYKTQYTYVIMQCE